MKMINFDFSILISNAIRQLPNIKTNLKIGEIINPICDALVKYPDGRGAGDAIHIIDMVYMGISDHHRSEIACLIVHRFRNTLIDKRHHFNSLVNLTRACINLKSFDESYKYGLMAEEINNNDLDLLSNMTVASYLSNRQKEARERFAILKEKHQLRAAEVHALVNWRSSLKRTDGENCDELVEKFQKMMKSKEIDKFNLSLAELQKQPDGKSSWKCWQILCEWYSNILSKANFNSEYLRLLNVAGLAASCGKAIAFHPDKDNLDRKLLKWRRESLQELEFFDIQV